MDARTPAGPTAGVRIDPQLIYAVPLGIGVLLDRGFGNSIVPIGLDLPIGVVLTLLGVMLAIESAKRFRVARTSLQPWEPTTSLITDGPFSFSRNPVYLSYTLVYLGITFWVNTLWSFLFLPVVIGLMHFHVIRREEVYLEGVFGEAYRAYRGRVRRWL